MSTAKKSPTPFDALEVCLAAQQTGVPAERLRTLYPEHAEVLTDPLEGASLARMLAADSPSAECSQRSRTRLLGYAAQLRKQQRPRGFPILRRMQQFSWAFLLAMLILTTSGYGLYSAAAQSLPGASLYPVKRLLENVRLQIASPEQRAILEKHYNQRRLDEVQALVHRRSGGHMVSFWGTVEEQSDTRWVVDSIPVQLSADVRIIGEIRVGMVIEIEGETTPEGWILAHELHLNRRDVVGDVQHIAPTEWTVNGTTFKINQNTHFDGQPAEGDPVLVTLQAEEDGSLLAERIIRLVPLDPTQMPIFMPTPLPTYTPTPTEPNSEEVLPATAAASVSGPASSYALTHADSAHLHEHADKASQDAEQPQPGEHHDEHEDNH